ncbi:MAG: hypothetical protein FJX72_14540 [Armatimonadetes bacterium]|nr:hypothetical protein [Armatimonadota bacterium]
MRWVAALLGVALACAVGWAIWSRPAGQRSSPRSGRAAVPGDAARSAERGRLDVPMTADEKERRDYERARAPFMQRLRLALEPSDAEAAVGDDLAELRITVGHPDATSVERLRDIALTLGSADEGFRVITFWTPESGIGKPPRLLAEVTRGPGDRWTTFLR